MNDHFIAHVSALIRETENALGTRKMCFLVIESFEQAVMYFKGDSELFVEQIKKMVYVVKNTSPRISLLIFMFSEILENFFQEQKDGMSVKELQSILKKNIQDTLEGREKSVKKLLSCSQGIVSQNDVILIHSLSHSVFDVFKQACNDGISFRVIVAEQDASMTAEIIRNLQSICVPFTVISEYLLSHIVHEITKFFTGAVTINSHYNVIANAGSEAVVSEMKYHSIPTYLFITSDKLSLWEAREHHHTHKSQKHKCKNNIEYDKLIFSHDRLPVDMINYFVTNKGVLSGQEIKNLYNDLFADRDKWREKYGI